MELFNNVKEFGLSITEMDKLTGPVIGRAKSATFRTADIVGLDTLVHVANGIKDSTNDEANDLFSIPDYLQTMLDNKWLGSKTKQGFYKKEVIDGKKVFKTLDFETLEYTADDKPRFSVFEKTKDIDNLAERMPILFADKGRAGEFYRKSFYSLFQFVSNRIPEISDDIYKVDDGLNAGFGWKLGPFQTWDAVGIADTVKAMEEADKKPAAWVYEMLEAGVTSFYQIKEGIKYCYDIKSKSYVEIPGQSEKTILRSITSDKCTLGKYRCNYFRFG